VEPPAGRLVCGDRVRTPGDRQGLVVGERLIATNGAWAYTVVLDEGGTVEHLDFELRRLEPA
jgi:hypothetical protein